MGKRKRYTEEFKREAVRLLATRGDQPAADVAKGLGVSTGQLYEWQKKFSDVAATARSERGESKDEELARLRKENVRLRKEKEVLKKSIAFFVRETDR